MYELAGKSKLPWIDDRLETRSGSDVAALLETVSLSSHVLVQELKHDRAQRSPQHSTFDSNETHNVATTT